MKMASWKVLSKSVIAASVGIPLPKSVSSCLKRALRTSPVSLHLLDARDKDHAKKESQLTVKQEELFDELAKQRAAADKITFQEALKIYDKKEPVYRRGHVEFIYASLKKMKEFRVHRDINVYRQIIDLFPKDKMVAQNAWQVEFMHYPKQQQCCIDILDQMEENGVIPDDEMGRQLLRIFGGDTHAFRKYRRMMYWLPKFKYANPFYIPYELPDDRIEIAKLALNRMSVDMQNKIQVFQAADLDSSSDHTFVVSGQSPAQKELVLDHPTDKPVFVEGGFDVWLRHLCLKYFILRSEVTPKYSTFVENKDTKQDEFAFDWNIFKGDTQPNEVSLPPSVHEQEDGTILAICVTGTSSKDSLASWIKFLEKDNPTLSRTPVVFLLRTPEAGLQVYDGAKPIGDVELRGT